MEDSEQILMFFQGVIIREDNGLERCYSGGHDLVPCSAMSNLEYSIKIRGNNVKPHRSSFTGTPTQPSSLLTIILFTHCISETVNLL